MSSNLIEQFVASLYFRELQTHLAVLWLTQEYSCVHRRHCCFSTWLCSILVRTITKFHLDYRLLLELHALPLAAYSLAHHNTWSPWLCFQGSPLYDVNLEPRFGWGNKKKCLVYTVCACACQHAYVYVQTRLPRNSVANKHLWKQYIPGSLSPLPLLCLGTRLVWCVRWWKA